MAVCPSFNGTGLSGPINWAVRRATGPSVCLSAWAVWVRCLSVIGHNLGCSVARCSIGLFGSAWVINCWAVCCLGCWLGWVRVRLSGLTPIKVRLSGLGSTSHHKASHLTGFTICSAVCLPTVCLLGCLPLGFVRCCLGSSGAGSGLAGVFVCPGSTCRFRLLACLSVCHCLGSSAVWVLGSVWVPSVRGLSVCLRLGLGLGCLGCPPSVCCPLWLGLPAVWAVRLGCLAWGQSVCSILIGVRSPGLAIGFNYSHGSVCQYWPIACPSVCCLAVFRLANWAVWSGSGSGLSGSVCCLAVRLSGLRQPGSACHPSVWLGCPLGSGCLLTAWATGLGLPAGCSTVCLGLGSSSGLGFSASWVCLGQGLFVRLPSARLSARRLRLGQLNKVSCQCLGWVRLGWAVWVNWAVCCFVVWLAVCLSIGFSQLSVVRLSLIGWLLIVCPFTTAVCLGCFVHNLGQSGFTVCLFVSSVG